MTDTMLTTEDNPFSPFTEFEEWYAFDERMGYHTPSLLAGVARSSGDLTQEDQELIIEEAIDEIVMYNVSGRHKKVTADDYESVD